MMIVGVTAAGSGVGEAILRGLHHSNLDFKTVGFEMDPMKSGLHWTDRAFMLPPVSQIDEYMKALLHYIQSEGITALLPGTDLELVPLATHRQEIEASGCVLITGQTNALKLAVNKLALYEYCAPRHIPFIKTLLLQTAIEQAGELEYPLLAKPLSGSASVGVKILCNANDLKAMNGSKDYIVQSYIPYHPNDEPCCIEKQSRGVMLLQKDEVSSQFFIARNGEILGHFISVNQLKNGVPIQVVPAMDSPALSSGMKLAKALADEGLTGPVNIQGRMAGDGIRFFEVNARFTGITGVRSAMGYREVEAALREFVLHQPESVIRECLNYQPGYVGTRHVDEMIVPVAKVESVRSGKSVPVTAPNGTVLITGAGGYIGANVFHDLNSNANPSHVVAGLRNHQSAERLAEALNLPDLEFRIADLSEQTWSLDGINTVVHAAALRPIFKGDDTEFYRINVDGTRRLLEAAKNAGIKRFVFLSTQGVYGHGRPLLWQESLPPAPDDIYSTTKVIGEQLCRGFAGPDFQVIILRVARIFGQGFLMRPNELPHKFAALTARGEAMTITGGGTLRADLLHIRDLSQAIHKVVSQVLPSSPLQVYNIGSGHPLTIRELAETTLSVARALDLETPEPQFIPGNDNRSFGMDIRRARTVLDWHPRVSLESAVRELIENSRV